MQNLSHLADNTLVGMSSMANGNTISVPPPDGAPGSESEATADVELHSTPELELGPVTNPKNSRMVTATPHPASDYSWKRLKLWRT